MKWPCSAGWLCSLMMSTSMAVSNFFAFRTPSAHNNEAWGDYTMSMADHAPTCGWKLIVSSSYPLSSIAAWSSTQTRLDDRTYLITNENYNEDLVTNAHYRTGPITLRGQWGNTAPDVFISFYCVCTNLLLGCVDVPYTTVPPFDATPAPDTTTAPASETTTDDDHGAEDDDVTYSPAAAAATAALPGLAATAAPAALPGLAATAAPAGSNTATHSGDLYIGYHVIAPTKVFLNKKADACYTGASLSSLSTVRHVNDCHIWCRDRQDCAGVNFWDKSAKCDLVLENTDLNPGSLLTTLGCEYWKVVWKA